ncbi:MAG: hypothetical protein II714_00695 [Oscillospiraceae bacterium]|nr:hypothetical protein [Oscillospiraceae bacterium]MBQ9208748.1 hypothetical protein [Oscillospiraceae bacterium]
MDKIIQAVIDADRRAAQQIEAAEAEALELVAAAKEKSRLMIEDASKRADAEFAQLNSADDARVQKARADAEAQADEQIAAMERQFEANSDKWAKEIFDSCTV